MGRAGRALCFGLIAVCLASPASAAIYMQIDGGAVITGESTDAMHLNWIVLTSFSHGVQNLGCPGTGGKGNSEHSEFILTKPSDKSTTKLLENLNLGVTYGQVKIRFVRNVAGTNRVFQEYEFFNPRFQLSSMAGNEDFSSNLPMESWSLNYDSVTIRYTPFDAKGAPLPTQTATLNVSSCP